MSGIALRYRIDLAELLAANPTVNPRFMSIGTLLIIPPSRTVEPTTIADGADISRQTPTPVPIEIGDITCTSVEDGGMWCFQPVRNQQSYPIEGLTAIFQVADSTGEIIRSQTAALPLDLLPPGMTLPLAAYFPADQTVPIPQPPAVNSQLVSALPNRDDGRYLRGHTANVKVLISTDGLSAAITLDVMIDQPDTRARRIWVAAVAYDRNGKIIGVRRWEKPDRNPIATGETQPVTMYIYSIGGEINRVELFTENRP